MYFILIGSAAACTGSWKQPTAQPGHPCVTVYCFPQKRPLTIRCFDFILFLPKSTQNCSSQKVWSRWWWFRAPFPDSPLAAIPASDPVGSGSSESVLILELLRTTTVATNVTQSEIASRKSFVHCTLHDTQTKFASRHSRNRRWVVSRNRRWGVWIPDHAQPCVLQARTDNSVVVQRGVTMCMTWTRVPFVSPCNALNAPAAVWPRGSAAPAPKNAQTNFYIIVYDRLQWSNRKWINN